MTAPEKRAAFEPRRVGLTALTVLLGMQSLETLLPLMAFIFRDRLGWPSAQIGLLALAVFATGFLAAPLRRLMGGRRFLLLAAGGVGLLRLELQLWTGDPLADLGLALAATVLFFLALPALAADRTAAATRSLALGWMLGLAALTTLHVASGTWDMSWRSDAATFALVLVLVLAQWRLLAAVLAEAGERLEEPADVPWSTAGTWIGLGPFLFLELIILGNAARLTALTGWPAEAAATWAVAGRLLAVAAAVLVAVRPPSRGLVAAAGAALVASLAVPWPTGNAAAVLWLVAQVLAAALLARILLALGATPGGGGLARLGAAHGLALLVLAVVLFLYYGSSDLRLPLAKDALPILAALGLGLAAAGAARSGPGMAAAGRIGRGWLAAGLLLAVPLFEQVTASPVRAAEAKGFPLRVMTYNLHFGIDPRGHLGMEAIAAAIEAERPDVVALQEVSRGWVIAGSVDAVGWLSRRLGMPYVFAPTADPLWGNAILSRRPITRHLALDLPTRELLIRRGFVAAEIDVADGDPLQLICTHFHHPQGGGAVRERQSRTLLDFWQGRGRTAILGDLNAVPGSAEIEMLRRAGLRDALELAGVAPGYTHSSWKPVKRIDYVWISPDLVVREASVPRVAASDHLPVMATLERGP